MFTPQEEDPFGTVAVAEPEAQIVDVFAVPDGGDGHAEIEELLAGTREVIVALESALQKAREHEQRLVAKLDTV